MVLALFEGSSSISQSGVGEGIFTMPQKPDVGWVASGTIVNVTDGALLVHIKGNPIAVMLLGCDRLTTEATSALYDIAVGHGCRIEVPGEGCRRPNINRQV